MRANIALVLFMSIWVVFQAVLFNMTVKEKSVF